MLVRSRPVPEHRLTLMRGEGQPSAGPVPNAVALRQVLLPEELNVLIKDKEQRGALVLGLIMESEAKCVPIDRQTFRDAGLQPLLDYYGGSIIRALTEADEYAKSTMKEEVLFDSRTQQAERSDAAILKFRAAVRRRHAVPMRPRLGENQQAAIIPLFRPRQPVAPVHHADQEIKEAISHEQASYTRLVTESDKTTRPDEEIELLRNALGSAIKIRHFYDSFTHPKAEHQNAWDDIIADKTREIERLELRQKLRYFPEKS